jgi:DNA-binding NtrC family response regulator
MEALFPLPLKEGLDRWTERYARAYLDHVLRLSGGSVTGAAEIAGVNRRYLQRMMKKYNLRGGG